MLVAALLLSWVRPAAAAQTAFATSSSAWDGYVEFVRLAQRQLGSAQVILTKRLDYRTLSPDDALLLVHPSQALDDSSLSAFLADGGRLALLDDFGQGESLLHKFGIRRVPPPTDPLSSLRSNPDLAIAVPALQHIAESEAGRHPIANHVEQVVTNHPRVLKHPDLTPVLEIPAASGPAAALAVTGVIAGQGRLLVLGDPSVFINLMLRYPGNRHLAEGVVSYLAGSYSQQSTVTTQVEPADSSRKLYILTNDFQQVGSYGDEASWTKDLANQLKTARQAVEGMAKTGMPPELATSLAAVMAIWIFLYQLRSQLRLPRLLALSFTRPPALSGQAGYGGRARLLSSPKTNSLLPVMELDSALRETIQRKLALPASLPLEELLSAVRQTGVSSGDTQELGALLREFRRYGQSLSDGKPLRATERELSALHARSMRLIAVIQDAGGNA